MTEPPTGTVTMLFTDIEGSTPLVHTLGDDYGAVLGQERRLLRKAVADSRGFEVDCRADELFAVFQRAEDGVVAAVAAQQLLAAHAWPEGSPVRVRMGLHTGEPGVEGGIYLGSTSTVPRVSARPGTAGRSCSHRRRVTWSPTGSRSGIWAATRWQG
jgi:class 3 adenylate cyclase